MDAPVLRDAADPLPPIEIPTVTATATNGLLAGRTVTFRMPPSRMWIAIERRQFTNHDLWEKVLEAVVDHDLGVDIEALPSEHVAELAALWFRAVREAAVPPPNGSSSPGR